MNQAGLNEAAERRAELAAFLKDMRARIRPEEAGLQPGRRRRVKGLRREEVAALARRDQHHVVHLAQTGTRHNPLAAGAGAAGESAAAQPC